MGLSVPRRDTLAALLHSGGPVVRGLPSTVTANGVTWQVAGSFQGGGGAEQGPVMQAGFFAGYTVTRRSLVSIGGNNDNGIPRDAKQTRMASHPDGRSFLFGGDWNTSAYSSGSGVQNVYSLNPRLWTGPGQTPGWKGEHDYWPLDGNAYPVRTDCTSVAWDSKRRVFWMVGGAAPYAPQAEKPAGAVAVRSKVMMFDPARPKGTQWIDTGVDFRSTQDSEGYGPAFYDPVLDVVWGQFQPAYWGTLMIWDCAAQAWRGDVRLEGFAALEQNNTKMQLVGFDAVARKLWWLNSNGYRYLNYAQIVEIALPSTLAELPAVGGATVTSWNARATVRWTNATGNYAIGGSPVRRGAEHYAYFWRPGPIGNDAQQPGADIGRAATGRAGHAITSNANYGSATTGFLVNLATGVQEDTSLPLPTMGDGTGWVIPNHFHWDGDAIVYGTVDAGSMGDVGTNEQRMIENNMLIARRPRPAWVPSDLTVNAWYQVPGTALDTGLSAADDALMTARQIPYKTSGRGPWAFSGGTLRANGSVMMIHGGGGNDGEGNEIFGIRLAADAPQWEVLMPPTPRDKVVPNDTGDFPNYNASIHNFNWPYNHDATGAESVPRSPVACHSYTYQQYLDGRDCWVRVGSSMVWGPDGGTFPHLDAFYWAETAKADKAQRTWATQAFADMPRTLSAPRGIFKHPWTEDVYAGGGYYLLKWQHATNTWTTHAGGAAWLDPQIIGPIGVDPVQNCVLVPWFTQNSTRGMLIDCSTPDSVVSLGAADWLGDTADWAFGDTSSLVWCPDWQCLVAFASTNWDLMKVQINRSTNKVTLTKVPISQYAAPHRPTALPRTIGGLSNRLQYAPELGGLVFVHYGDRGVYFIQTRS